MKKKIRFPTIVGIARKAAKKALYIVKEYLLLNSLPDEEDLIEEIRRELILKLRPYKQSGLHIDKLIEILNSTGSKVNRYDLYACGVTIVNSYVFPCNLQESFERIVEITVAKKVFNF